MMPIKKLFIIFVLTSLPSVWAMDLNLPQEDFSEVLRIANDFGFGVTEEIALLLDADASAKWDRNWSDLIHDVAIMHDEVRELCLEYDMSGELYPDYETLLASSAASKNELLCRLLLAARADVNYNPPGATTPLIEAAHKGHESLCRIFLEAGANSDAWGVNRTTALIEAAHKGHESLCRIFLQAGADANAQGVSGTTPLIEATRKGNVSLCRLLLNAKSHIQIRDEYGRTALINAAQQGDASLCELFVQLNNSIKATLYSLYRLKKEGKMLGRVLYNNCKVLLLSHFDLKNYVPTKKLLCARDVFGKRAYNYLPIDCLNPYFGYFFPYDPTDKEIDSLAALAGYEEEESKKLITALAKCAQSDGLLDFYGFKPKGRDCFVMCLPMLASFSCNEFECELMVHRQHRVNAESFTLLQCMNHMKNAGNKGAALLYQRFRSLLFPHLYHKFSYVPLVPLIREITDGGKLFNGMKCLDLDYIQRVLDVRSKGKQPVHICNPLPK
jgi:ankyrin repeat protein